MTKIDILYKDNSLEIEYFFRGGKDKTIVYIHGLGCSKSDFNDAINNSLFYSFNILTFDLVGHGNTSYIKNIDILDTVEITNLLLEKLDIDNIILIGHSLGGVVALMYAEKYINKVSSFINVEGNLSGDDCFFSRRATEIDFNTFENKCFNIFKEQLIDSNKNGFWKYVQTLESHKPLKSFHDICPSLVHHSDNGGLLERYMTLSLPKLFMYGSENEHLPYIGELEKNNCKTIGISDSNHFPHFDNPDEYYQTIHDFLKRV